MKVYARKPLDLDQVTVPRGQVYLIPERCKGCEICVQFCPRQVLIISRRANRKGYHDPEIAPGEAGGVGDDLRLAEVPDRHQPRDAQDASAREEARDRDDDVELASLP